MQQLEEWKRQQIERSRQQIVREFESTKAREAQISESNWKKSLLNLKTAVQRITNKKP